MVLVNLFLYTLMGLNLNKENGYAILPRSDWYARPPTKPVSYFKYPAPYVIIHHSYLPAACYTRQDCRKAMQNMQDFHQLKRGWNDIGYSYAIGGDGNIYTGRGFNVVGAHALNYNSRSVGICLIGNGAELPSKKMINATNYLIKFGVNSGHISRDYVLLGHRQVDSTECPGNRLFFEISTWPRFSQNMPVKF